MENIDYSDPEPNLPAIRTRPSHLETAPQGGGSNGGREVGVTKGHTRHAACTAISKFLEPTSVRGADTLKGMPKSGAPLSPPPAGSGGVRTSSAWSQEPSAPGGKMTGMSRAAGGWDWRGGALGAMGQVKDARPLARP